MSFLNKGKNKYSAFLNLLGLILVIALSALLITDSALNKTVWHTVSFSVYSGFTVFMYFILTLYYILPLNRQGREVFRVMSHILVFLFIGSSFVPLCLTKLRGPIGWTIFGIAYAIVLTGILFKSLYFDAPKFVYNIIYGVTALLVISFIYPILKGLSLAAIINLLLVFLSYISVLIIYNKDKLYLSDKFTIHESIHIFSIMGTLLNYTFMYLYL